MAAKYPLMRNNILREDLDAVIEHLKQDDPILTNGPQCVAFEQEWSKWLGVKYSVFVNSGASANLLSMTLLKLRHPEGGEVIVPPLTWVSDVASVLQNGFTPVFADIDPATHNLDPEAVRRMVTPRTTGIIGVHLWGRPAPVEALQSIADEHGLQLLFDAAHAFGCSHAGRKIGGFGRCEVLSFHATKVFNTFEGGAIVCADAQTKQHIDHLKNFGFVNETTVVATGINGKMSEFNAALGLLQLQHIDQALARRKEIDAIYRAALQGVPGMQCLGDSGEKVANHAYFPVLVGDDYFCSRDALYERLREHGIFARRYFYPLISEFPMYRGLMSANPANLSVATEASKRVLCLPIYPQLQPEEQARIIQLVREP